MSLNLSEIRFRAFQADEDFSVDDGLGILRGTIPAPAAPPTGGTGDAGAITAIHDGFFTTRIFGNYIWETYYDSELGPYTTVTPDTWHHVQWAETFHAGATVSVDDVVTVDGTPLFNRLAQDTGVVGMPNAAVFGLDTGDSSPVTIYLDDVSIDGVLIDDFEGTDFSAWDGSSFLVALSSDFAHGGSRSLKASTTGLSDVAIVQKNMVIADGETHTLDCWIYIPTSTFTAVSPGGIGDFMSFVQI